MRYEYKDPPARISASTVSSFSDCEQRFAYERLIKGMPEFPTPLPLVFGTVVHKAHERMWQQALNGKTSLTPGTVSYWGVFLNKVLRGFHGPESESSPPIAIRWLTKREKAGLGQKEIEEKINEKIKNSLGLGYLAFEAIRLDCLKQNEYQRTEIEFAFGSGDRKIAIQPPGSLSGHPLSGRIDRIHFWPDGEYIILDLKTGSAEKTQRNKLVRDIQMTTYDYVCRKLFGRPPKKMFIQLLPRSKDFLEKHKEYTLETLRSPIDPRTETHFINMARLVEDVRLTIEFVVNGHRYFPQQLEVWEPTSDWGRMAGFKGNIVQKRFVPRIGETWCDSCPFIDLCQVENAQDWETYRLSKNPKVAEGKTDEFPLINIKPPNEQPQGELFSGLKPSSQKRSKSEAEIRKEMLASGEFIERKRLAALIKKISNLIPTINSQPCPCRRNDLVPINFFAKIPDFRHRKISTQELVASCPYPECPFKLENASD